MTTSKSLVIAIDIDDVIAETHWSTRTWANQVSGLELDEAAYKVPGDYWGYYERVWETHGVHDVLKHDDLIQAIIDDQIKVPLLAGASFAIKQLQKFHKVILITSRYQSLKTVTRTWVSEHIGKDIEIYFAKNNHNDQKTKGEICIEHGASLLIDDNIGHCLDAMNHGIDAILFGEYGWQHAAPASLLRCPDWPAVLEYVNGRS